MSQIQTYLNKIKNAIYGKDVRQAIHDGIRQCYEDGKSGQLDLIAREGVAEIKADYQTKLMLNDAEVSIAPQNCVHATESAKNMSCHVVTLTTYNHAVWDVVALVNVFDDNATVEYLYKGSNVSVDYAFTDGKRIIRIWNNDGKYGTNTARMTVMKI